MDLSEVAPPGDRRSGCALGRLLQELDDVNAGHVRGWLASEQWSDGAVADVLREKVGFNKSYKVVEGHRNGRCSCDKRGWL